MNVSELSAAHCSDSARAVFARLKCGITCCANSSYERLVSSKFAQLCASSRKHRSRDLLLEPLELRDRVVGRADHAGPRSIIASTGSSPQVFGAHPVDRRSTRSIAGSRTPLFARLLARLGDVHRADQAQAARVHGAAVLGRDLVRDLPVGAERVEAGGFVAATHSMPRSYLPASVPPDGVTVLATQTSGCGLVYGSSWHARVRQVVPLGLLRDGLAFEQAQDHVERLGHAVALLVDRECRA